jgi:protein O-mannosyl-transferase
MRRQRQLLLLAIFIAASFAIFARTLGFTFVSDDFQIIRILREGSHPFTVLQPFLRVLSAVSLWIDFQIWGLDARGFHAMNVLLHALVSFGVFKLGQRFLPTEVALVGAILFLAAPVHVEPVTWVSCRPDLLAATFGVWALFCWLRATELRKSRLRLLALALLACAFASKESAVPLCFVLALWEARAAWLALQPGERRQALARAATALLLFPIYFVARRLILGIWVGGYGAQVHLAIDPAQMLTAFWQLPARILLGIPPSNWVPGYFYDADLRALWGLLPALPRRLLLALLVVGGTIWLLRALREGALKRAAVALLVAYVLLLLPVLNLAALNFSAEGERLLYLPSVMLFLALAALLGRISPTRRALGIVTALLVLGSVAATQRALGPWRQASALVRTLVPELAAAARDQPIVVVDLPDNVRGAYVLRNGVVEAVTLERPEAQLGAIGYCGLMSATEPVIVTATSDEVALRLTDSRSRIAHYTPLAGLTADTNPQGHDSMVLRGVRPAHLWYYSAGHIHPLP